MEKEFEINQPTQRGNNMKSTENKTEEKKTLEEQVEIQAAGASEKPVQEEKTDVAKETPGKKKEEPTKEEEKKTEEGKGKKKEVKKIKKTEAVARGQDLSISKKHVMAILGFLKGRKIDEAIKILELVLKKRQAVPFRGYEIPHRKGKGISEGRYPRNASREMIKILKSLQANATMVNVDLDKAVLSGKANDASRPYKRGGSMRFKKTHVELWVKEIPKKKLKEKAMEMRK